MVFCGKYFIPMLISNKYIFKRDIVLHYLFRIWKISVFLFFPSSKCHLNIYQKQGYPLNHINTYWYFTLNKTFFLLHSTACGILVLLGIKPVSPTLESKVLTTGPPGKSWVWLYIFIKCVTWYDDFSISFHICKTTRIMHI